MFKSQAGQDKFVVNVLKGKTNGFFLEIGSHYPVFINNSFVLEKLYDWNGIMVEYDRNFLESYEKIRPNSIHVINDARNIDYSDLFKRNKVPEDVDYLQIDVEADNGSTIATLRKIETQLMSNHRFAVVTFEHDIYRCGEYPHTRTESREIFDRNGYVRVFTDVNDNNPGIVFEDWYVHPDLVDMDYVNELMDFNKNKYVNPEGDSLNSIVPLTINFKDIVYPNTLPIPASVVIVGDNSSLSSEKVIMLNDEQKQTAKKARGIVFEKMDHFDHDIPDTFTGIIRSDRIIVKRRDQNHGWGVNIIGKMLT